MIKKRRQNYVSLLSAGKWLLHPVRQDQGIEKQKVVEHGSYFVSNLSLRVTRENWTDCLPNMDQIKCKIPLLDRSRWVEIAIAEPMPETSFYDTIKEKN